MGIDWQQVGGYLSAVGLCATGAWAWFLKHQRAAAETRAEVAESDAGRTVADAQSTVYKLLQDRLTTVENDVRTLRQELAAERAHSRRLELHIWKLEGLMRKAGMEPPPFVDADPAP